MPFTGAACGAAAILLIAAGDAGAVQGRAVSADAVAAPAPSARGGGREGDQGAQWRWSCRGDVRVVPLLMPPSGCVE